jgi:hypothetical protein
LHEKSIFASQKPEFPRLKFGENLPKLVRASKVLMHEELAT